MNLLKLVDLPISERRRRAVLTIPKAWFREENGRNCELLYIRHEISPNLNRKRSNVSIKINKITP
jgi:hypothetical protein